MSIQVIGIKEVIEKVGRESKNVKIENIKVAITEQETGYGYKKLFSCPNCYERRTKLYIYNSVKAYCRSCSPISPYKAIQNSTDGGTRELEYRINRIAKEYGIEFEYPFNYMNLLLKRPKYYRHDKWREGITKLQVLENMRFNTIFKNKKYKSKLINEVLNNWEELPYNLYELQKYVLDW